MSVGDDGLNQDLVDQGAINQIVGKFSDLDKTRAPNRVSQVHGSWPGGGGGGGMGYSHMKKTRVLVDNFGKNP